MSKNAVQKGIERGRKATKKAFAKVTKKPTSRELLIGINKKMDKALHQQEEINRLRRGSG